ncbi:MFS transporter [Novosphingobium profundi]|uniref:MFS transporter n=1 Tax=Novosphingobium profundi TaxID=1774954 RepID=UPI001BD9DBE1|nr:MFS transporter [Novosphingobium profundi]MBT0670723.1 MFS transporter [Novosphingobium profundi]
MAKPVALQRGRDVTAMARSNPTHDDVQMPSGPARSARFYGWKLAFLLFLGMAINTALPIYALGLLNVHMADEFQLNRATLGTAFAIYMLMTGLPGPLTARLIEAVGIRWTLVIGNAMLLAGSLAMGLLVTGPIGLVLAGGILLGGASAVAGPIPVQTLVTRWFSRRRALAMGLVLAGGGVTGMVFPPLLEQAVATSGWRSGWWYVALLAAFITLANLLFVRESPEDLGQCPDGGEAAVRGGRKSRRETAARVYQTSEQWVMRDVMRSRTFWLLLMCSTGVSAVYTIFYAQAVLQIRDLGYSTQTAAYLVSLSVGAGFAAHMLISFVGDRIDPKSIWAASLFLQGVGIGLFAGGATPWQLYAAIACLGIGNSGAILSLIMTFSNWFGVHAAPFVFGFGSAFSAACGALAPVASGYSYDQSGSFAPVFYAISVFCIGAAIILWFTRPPHLAQPASRRTPKLNTP